MPNVNPGLGTKLLHGIASSYTAIAQITEIDGPGMEWGETDTTNLDSTMKTSRPTLIDGGTVDLKIQYDPSTATHKLLTGFVASTTPSAVEEWKITWADTSGPTSVTFTGFLKSFKVNSETPEGNLMADCSIKINSMPTWPT